MSDLWDSDGFFNFPRHLDSLDGVPEDFAGGYVETDNGFRLHPDIEAEVEAAEDRLNANRAEHQAKIADLDAKLEARKRTIHEMVAGGAIRQALAEHGVKRELMKGAEAYLTQNLDIGITEQDNGQPEAFVKDAYGEVSVSHAVKSWLETDDGRGFRPEQPSPDAGRYFEAMRTLRATLH
jgi:hypothetical protein